MNRGLLEKEFAKAMSELYHCLLVAPETLRVEMITTLVTGSRKMEKPARDFVDQFISIVNNAVIEK